MDGFSQLDLLLTLSFIAGGLHVLAPDHWLPLSVLAWQKRWRFFRTASLTTAIFSVHVAAGFLLYGVAYLVLPFLPFELGSGDLFLLALLLVLIFNLVRAWRFQRVREVLRSGDKGVWGFFALVSLLGPCEFLVPILLKANQLQVQVHRPLVAFWLGSCVVGIGAVVAGAIRWEKPLGLPQALTMAEARTSLLPLGVAMVVSLGILFQ